MGDGDASTFLRLGPVVLRGFQSTDVEVALAKIFRNLGSLSQWSGPYWGPVGEAFIRNLVLESFVAGQSARANFAITRDSILVGTGSVHRIDWRNRNAQIGLAIWDEADRGRGTGQSAVRLLTSWAQRQLGLVRLEARILHHNEACIRAFKSCRFRFEGTLRSALLLDGALADVDVYAILAGEDQRS